MQINNTDRPSPEQVKLAEKLWNLMEELKTGVGKNQDLVDLIDIAVGQVETKTREDYQVEANLLKMKGELNEKITTSKDAYDATLYILRKTGVCSTCRGRGRRTSHECEVCKGSGWSPNK